MMLPYNPSKHPWPVQKSIQKNNVAEIKKCWIRRYASFLHLKLDEVPVIQPRHMEHKAFVRRDLPVVPFLCGKDLASNVDLSEDGGRSVGPTPGKVYKEDRDRTGGGLKQICA